MRKIFFLITFLLLATSVSAYNYPRDIHGYNMWSGITNFNTWGHEFGHNPYYARTSGLTLRYNGPRAQMNIRNKLDYQIWKNPDLMMPVYSTNDHRQNRWLYRGYFTRHG